MIIESLQIKRVTDNWDEHKDYEPLDGECVFILSGVISDAYDNLIVIGDGSSKLAELVSTKERVYFSADTVTNLINNGINGVTANIPVTNDHNTSPIESATNSDGTSDNANRKGNSANFARADHTHNLGKANAEKALGVSLSLSSATCRRIRAGTGNPPTSGVNRGDIYIKYDA